MEKTLNSLHEIVKNNLSFQDYARQLKNDSSYTDEEKRKIRMLVNQVINFYFRYQYIVNYGEEEPFTLRSVVLIAMYSVNRRRNFVEFSYESMLALALDEEARIAEKFAEQYFPLRIPENMSREDQMLGIATRFSVPLSLVNRLREDIGRRNIIKFFANRYEERYGIVNEKLRDVADFYEEFTDFEYDPVNETFYFKERGFLKDTTPYKDGLIIVSSHSVLDMYDRIILLNPKKVLFNLHDGTNLLLLFAFLNPDLEIVANVPSLKARRILEHLIRKFELKNIRTKAPGNEQFDLVVVSLSNSMLNGNVRYRDLYLTLPEDFSQYSERAAKELNQSVANVREEGHLLLITNTVIREETHYQVLNFLKAHEDFVLEREKQHFHFNKGHESVYYALVKKTVPTEEEVQPDDAQAPQEVVKEEVQEPVESEPVKEELAPQEEAENVSEEKPEPKEEVAKVAEEVETKEEQTPEQPETIEKLEKEIKEDAEAEEPLES